MVKAVCFDLDGVYFTEDGFRGFKDSLEALGATREHINHQLHGKPMELFKRGQVTEEEYWQETIKTLGINIDVDVIISMLAEHYEVNLEVQALVTKLRERGIQTCICSNNFVTRVEQLDGKFSFLKDFDVAVFSYEVGVLKPSITIFKELVRRTELDPDEIVYSDDSEQKITGALKLGIQAFPYQNYRQFLSKLETFGISV